MKQARPNSSFKPNPHRGSDLPVDGRFYIDLGRWYWWLWLGGAAMAILALWGDLPATIALLFLLLFFALAFSFPAWTCAVRVTDSGLILYQMNRLEWHEVVAADLRSVLGLEYLVITRQKGMNYWIPLYLKERAKFSKKIIEVAPADNPIPKTLVQSGNT